jgi:CDP-glycerol glycerophosphotransferase (TagB/SpsB family)
VIACADRAKLQAVYPNQNFTNLWLPHGNSDKGWRCTTFEVLEPKEIALVYGQKMIDFMSALHVKPETVMVGNFRRAYFEKHKEFYQKIIEKEISLPKGNKTFLYAPTWEDRENNGSFWALFPTLAETIPDDCNLIVKIHPNTVQLYEARIEAAIGKYKKKNILILTEFFPIYPLLSICDAYIGDMSSIGYDFLSFGRPMYFINASKREAGDPGLYLFRCGEELNPAVFTKQQGNFSEVRKQTYDYTFATVDYSTLMGGIMNTVCKSLRLPAAGYASIS